MVPIEIAKSAASNISALTLEQAPGRLLKFLQGVAVDAGIATQFRDELGWSPQRAREGWALFDLLEAASVVPSATVEDPSKLAIVACENWHATGLARVRTVLEATYPAQARFLFHDFGPPKGCRRSRMWPPSCSAAWCSRMAQSKRRAGTRRPSS